MQIEFDLFNENTAVGNKGLAFVDCAVGDDRSIELLCNEITVYQNIISQLSSLNPSLRLTSLTKRVSRLLTELSAKRLAFSEGSTQKARRFLQSLTKLESKKWNRTQKNEFDSSFKVPSIINRLARSQEKLTASTSQEKYDRAEWIANQIRNELVNDFTTAPVPIIWMIISGLADRISPHNVDLKKCVCNFQKNEDGTRVPQCHVISLIDDAEMVCLYNYIYLKIYINFF